MTTPPVEEPEREWYCEAEAIGFPTTPCSPDMVIHSSPCGWRMPEEAPQ